MSPEEFIKVIKQVVVNSAAADVEENLIEPPGRKPANRLTGMSNWYNKLDENDKAVIKQIISESVNTAIFGILCVLDGVRAVDDDKGELVLLYVKDGIKDQLNDPNKSFLHDIFNAE